MVAGERRRPAASSTDKTVMKTSSDRRADKALPYTPDGGRPTARAAKPSVCPGPDPMLETTAAHPKRAWARRRRRRSLVRGNAGGLTGPDEQRRVQWRVEWRDWTRAGEATIFSHSCGHLECARNAAHGQRALVRDQGLADLRRFEHHGSRCGPGDADRGPVCTSQPPPVVGGRGLCGLTRNAGGRRWPAPTPTVERRVVRGLSASHRSRTSGAALRRSDQRLDPQFG